MKNYFFVSAFCILALSSCATIPDGVRAVEPFDQSRYLGDWYEIARMDFRFERGLNNTKANYSINGDGSIKVINSGYNYTKKVWKEAVGKAKFVDVEIGMRTASEVQVISGLKSGDTILTTGLLQVKPGMSVKITKTTSKSLLQ